jgi:beta-galactosidase
LRDGTTEDHRCAFLRQGDPDFQAFHHDLYRAVGARRSGGYAAAGRWWVMEQQPGPVNWAPWNPAPLPGMVRLWAWEAFAHGAEVVSYFRWRQAPFAQEQMHAGLLRPDSAPAPALPQVRQVADEIAAMGDIAAAPAPVAIVFDYESAWAWQTQPQGRDFDYFRLAFSVYRALRRLGLSVDFLPPDAGDLSAYGMVLVPGLATLSDRLKAALPTVGGRVILGPRTNAKTPGFAISVPLPPNLPGLDCTVSLVESLPPGVGHPLPGVGAVRHWLEHLEGSAPVTLATDDGHTVAMRSGKVEYLGGWLDDAAMADYLARACAETGITTRPVTGGLRLRDTATLTFAINYGADPATCEGHSIPGAGVAWWPRGA